MKKCKITVVRKVTHQDLIDKYEIPQANPCPLKEGEVFYSVDALMPQGFCESAWQNLYPYVLALSSGGMKIFNDWMKDERSAIISCNDGFRPVSFLIEVII